MVALALLGQGATAATTARGTNESEPILDATLPLLAGLDPVVQPRIGLQLLAQPSLRRL